MSKALTGLDVVAPEGHLQSRRRRAMMLTGSACPGEVYPKIKCSPVVVFGVLSRMVLVRGR